MNTLTGEIDAHKCLSKWLTQDGISNPLLKSALTTVASDPDDISPHSIHVDMLFHCLHFAHKHGLNEKQIKTFVLAFNDVIKQTVCTGMPIERAVEHIRS